MSIPFANLIFEFQICVEIESNNRHQFCSCSPTPLNFNGENTLNIDPSFAQTLDLKQSDAVIISSAKALQHLEMIFVSPLSLDDWNIMVTISIFLVAASLIYLSIDCFLDFQENSADLIQSTLLSQIRVVNLHQVFKIWISKSFTVEVHVGMSDAFSVDLSFALDLIIIFLF